ncbi:hypothetical protein M9Y10_005270 [Tritrichomonas musculus]|uniref:Surface antigen BspA-like n=1 Tax=Tritrichomonas musculus TaxID=1915356 RepID=A0ABR2JKR3_9EUKA
MCEQLQIVEIPEESDLQMIGESSFECTNTDQLLIPTHVKRIGSKAFSNCSQFTYVDFIADSELQIIGSFSFACTNIDEITIPRHKNM